MKATVLELPEGRDLIHRGADPGIDLDTAAAIPPDFTTPPTGVPVRLLCLDGGREFKGREDRPCENCGRPDREHIASPVIAQESENPGEPAGPPVLEADVEQLLANTRRIRADVGGLVALTAPYDVKSDARKTGVSIHVLYREPVDIADSLRWSNLVADSPSLLHHILGQLEAAVSALIAARDDAAELREMDGES